MRTGLLYVKDILKRFGTYIYTGNRSDDIIMMEIEIEELFELRMITNDEFIKAKACLNREREQ